MLSNDLKAIMDVFLNNNYYIFIVGGAVRDILLNIEPHDYDLVTNALPEQVEMLFDKSIDVGKNKQFGIYQTSNFNY